MAKIKLTKRELQLLARDLTIETRSISHFSEVVKSSSGRSYKNKYKRLVSSDKSLAFEKELMNVTQNYGECNTNTFEQKTYHDRDLRVLQEPTYLSDNMIKLIDNAISESITIVYLKV